MFDRSPECCAKNIWDWSSGNLQCSVTGPQELVCTDGAQLLPQHVTNLEPKQNQQSTHITHRKLFIKLDPGGIHTSYLSRARGENLVMWRNLSTWQMVRWSNSPHDRLSCGKNIHMRNLDFILQGSFQCSDCDRQFTWFLLPWENPDFRSGIAHSCSIWIEQHPP